ncbi:hypothetical protein CYMTET_43006 [Cymbomonas tetramitiformis]|uniref:Uncharacterized protein n=1 Tax=Cymbomonas tetramitiformis TaxID=36881 RepID=A0AAE0C2X6_9CHLO|nr:hypothetical protein CYMTET_43006 [Cymbomonas tetramitiformis]
MVYGRAGPYHQRRRWKFDGMNLCLEDGRRLYCREVEGDGQPMLGEVYVAKEGTYQEKRTDNVHWGIVPMPDGVVTRVYKERKGLKQPARGSSNQQGAQAMLNKPSNISETYACQAYYTFTEGIGWSESSTRCAENYVLHVDRAQQRFLLEVGKGQVYFNNEPIDIVGRIEGDNLFINEEATGGSDYFELSQITVTWNADHNLPEITDEHDWLPTSEQREIEKNIRRQLMHSICE